MSLKIKNNLVVTIDYKLEDDTGHILDSSHGDEPLSYLHGTESLVPGLEKVLMGKSAGDAIKVSILPKEAYGEIMAELVQEVDREAFKDVEPLEVGMEFNSQDEDGTIHHVEVKKIEDKKITIDGNHPFAGINLNFDIRIISVREASEEELDHGHVHDEHSHHH